MKESIVGKQAIADYLLYSLNRLNAWEGYVKAWGLDGPTDDIEHLLRGIAQKTGTQPASLATPGYPRLLLLLRDNIGSALLLT